MYKQIGSVLHTQNKKIECEMKDFITSILVYLFLFLFSI